jgi:hypothetical protein
MSSQSSQTAADRFFGGLAYLLPIADVYFFGMFVFEQFPIVRELYTPLLPLVQINNGFGGFILFWVYTSVWQSILGLVGLSDSM